MGHEPAQQPARPKERVITNEAELRAALVETFLDNADSGRHADNDELIHQLGQWQRHRRRSG
jgi:predicted transcriptional regulator